MKTMYEIENMSELYSAIDELENGNLNSFEKEIVNNSVDEYRRTHPEEF